MDTQTSQDFLEELYSVAQGGTKEESKKADRNHFSKSHLLTQITLGDQSWQSTVHTHRQLRGLVRCFPSFRGKRAEINGEES